MSQRPFDRAFDFLHANDRPDKPRGRGITEIRGPYYDPMGPRELRDILDTMGAYVDIYKMPRATIGDILYGLTPTSLNHGSLSERLSC